MKLVGIYGPPAVGKLTVARELSKLTGYKILHNHMTRNLIGSIISYDNPEYYSLIYLFRKKLVEAAAKRGVEGLIFTFAYSGKSGKEKISQAMVDAVKKYGGDAYFVQLCCSVEELKRRVKGKSRVRYEKISDVKTLNSELAKHDFSTRIRNFRTLRIDNTRLSAKVVARKIKEYYRL